ncbi:hypothetical protein LMG9673_04801 [Ralstonia pseudosolanacearum]|nr:hypothetical protein LMG9673_04801 [Ralstonia pseudosolanacearum]
MEKVRVVAWIGDSSFNQRFEQKIGAAIAFNASGNRAQAISVTKENTEAGDVHDQLKLRQVFEVRRSAILAQIIAAFYGERTDVLSVALMPFFKRTQHIRVEW